MTDTRQLVITSVMSPPTQAVKISLEALREQAYYDDHNVKSDLQADEFINRKSNTELIEMLNYTSGAIYLEEV